MSSACALGHLHVLSVALGTCCHLCLLLCARFACGARARVPDMYNNATMGQGLPSGRGVPWGDHTLGPAGPHEQVLKSPARTG